VISTAGHPLKSTRDIRPDCLMVGLDPRPYSAPISQEFRNTMAAPQYDIDSKSVEDLKVEDISKDGAALPVLEDERGTDYSTAVSKFADLTSNECIKKFRRLYAMGLCCSLGGL
jgi:hypothetical protein